MNMNPFWITLINPVAFGQKFQYQTYEVREMMSSRLKDRVQLYHLILLPCVDIRNASISGVGNIRWRSLAILTVGQLIHLLGQTFIRIIKKKKWNHNCGSVMQTQAGTTRNELQLPNKRTNIIASHNERSREHMNYFVPMRYHGTIA